MEQQGTVTRFSLLLTVAVWLLGVGIGETYVNKKVL